MKCGGRDMWYGRLFKILILPRKSLIAWSVLRRQVFGPPTCSRGWMRICRLVGRSQVRDFKRWLALGMYVWPNADGDWPKQYIRWYSAFLKNFISQRMAWLDRQFLPAPIPIKSR